MIDNLELKVTTTPSEQWALSSLPSPEHFIFFVEKGEKTYKDKRNTKGDKKKNP